MSMHDELARAVAEKIRQAMGSAQALISEREAHGKLSDPLVRREIERMVEEKLAQIQSAIEEKATRIAQRKFELVVEDPDAPQIGWPPSPDVLYEPARDELAAAIQKANDELYILCKIYGVRPSQTKYWQQLERKGLLKALSTTAAGAGEEWVPEGFSRRLWDGVVEQLRLAGLHDHITMPTKTFQLPVEGTDPTAYLTSENTEITASDAGTAEVVLDAKTIGVRQVLSAELSEDAMIPLLPRLQAQLARAIARGIENAIVNGDTSDPHMDADVTDPADVRKAWVGYRKKALTDSAANADLSTLNAENLLAIKRAMGKYAADPAECVWVVGISAFNQLLLLRDQAGNPVVSTVDKYGAQATIVTGELARLFGIPVVVSPLIREDLNASGVYDGTTVDRTVLFLVNRRAFVLGDRRRITLETDKNIANQQIQLVATWRGDFKHCYGSDVTVGMGYNIAA